MAHGESRHRWLYAGALGASGICALAIALGVSWIAIESVPAFRSEDVDETAAVVELDFHAVTPVTLTASSADASLRYFGHGGLVTKVMIEPGFAVTPGQALIQVDGADVLGWVSTVSFYRDLAPGDEGEDVEVLQQHLAALGYYSSEIDGNYSVGTQEAVKQLQQTIRVRESDGVFRRSYVIRLPSDNFLPAIVNFSQDAPITDGAILAESTAVGSEITVEAALEVPDGSYSISLETGTLEAQVQNGTWTIESSDESLIRAFSALPGNAGSVLTAAGSARLVEPVPVMAIPPAALIVASNGSTCVFRIAGDSGDIVMTTVVGTDISGAALIKSDAGLASGDLVDLRPPASVRECQS